jgi:hypothetical protein
MKCLQRLFFQKLKLKNMKNILFLFFLLMGTTTYGQTYKSLVTTADSFYQAKDYKKSVEFYKEALSETFKSDQKKATPFYNAACSAALAGENKLAFEWLNNGWTKLLINTFPKVYNFWKG